jgi:DNA-binding NtrC family response regulator
MAKRATILIVNKEKILVDLLIRSLSSPALLIVGATSADEGGRLAAMHAPDLLVIDPSIENGIPLLSSVRSGPFKAKVIAVAGSEDIRKMVQGMGVNTVVDRDAGLDSLVAAIRAALPPDLNVLGEDNRISVLVCDDEDQIRNVLSEFLTSRNYAVSTAKNGREALERVESNPGIQIMLLDVSMPLMGGMEVLGQVMSRDPHPNVIMMTAVADREIARQAMKIGAFDYILKPFDFGVIDASITACLSHFEYRKQPWWKRLTRG